MRLRTSCELEFECLCETPTVLMLRPRLGGGQRVLQDTLTVEPGSGVTSFADVFGNRCDRLVAPAGMLRIRSEVVADVAASVAAEAKAPRTPFAALPPDALHFTLASRYCPSDRLQALAREVTRDATPGYAEVQAICDHVQGRLRYAYGVSNGSTDALETLQEGRGVCRDYAHVAIALCRAIDIPARMVVGYLHERDPMDMHAWVEAHVGGAWYTFDPSEARLRGGRVVLAHGRDAADVAFVTDYGALALRSMKVTVRETAATSRPRARLRAAG